MNKKIPILIILGLFLIAISGIVNAVCSSFDSYRIVNNQTTSDIAVSINGSGGWNDEIIWVNPSQCAGEMKLCYSSSDNSNYEVYCDNTTLMNYEIEDGVTFGGGNNPTGVYNSGAFGIYHYGVNSPSSTNDSQITSNNAIVTNANYNTLGRFGGGYDFFATGDKIITSSQTGIALQGTARTMLTWIFQPSAYSPSVAGIMGWGTTGSNYDNNDLRMNNGNILYWHNVGDDFETTLAVPKDKWSFVGLTTSGTTVRVFLNQTSQSAVKNLGTEDSPMRMGTLSTESIHIANSTLDEVRFYNITLSVATMSELDNNSKGLNMQLGEAVISLLDYINISSPFPTNNTQYNVSLINFNATINTTNTTNVTLYINGTLNETKTLPAGTEVPINFSKTMNNGDWNFSIFVNDSLTSNETTATHEFYVDVTDPIIAWINPLNSNTTTILGNLSSNITITDTNLFSYEYNITHLNGSILNNFNFSNSSLTGLTTKTISDVADMTLFGGTFKSITRICDGHTDYDINFPAIIWQNEIHFNKVKVYQEDKADTYKAIYQKERDRYTFNFETKTESYSKYFIVEGENEIIILNGKTEYKGHLIVDGRYWVDFEEWDISKVEVERITDNKVRVKTYSNNKKKDWKFKSIGELNCITEEVEFFSINYTQTFEATVLETSTSNFKINITGSLTNLSGNVTYNNTEYTGTRTNYVNHSTLSVNIPSPNVSTDTNITFNWTIQADSLLFNTSSNLQLVLDLAFDGCENNTDILLNLTQQNEELLTDILPTVLEVDLNITGPTGESWNYHNSTNLTSLDICLPAGTLNAFNLSTFTIDIIAGYDAVGYVQEFWNLDNGTVSNLSYFNPYTPTSINLYSLNSTDSTTFLFTYLDDVGLSIDDGIIHTHRKYIGDGVFREVERSKQDDNGETHVHLVEEDVIYFFEVSQYGIILFTSSTYNAKCLSSPCQIELKAVSSISDFPNDWLNIGGSLYHIETNSTSRISTLSYESNASNTFNYSIFQYNGSQTLLVNSSISTGTSGSIDLTIPISYGNDTYIGAIFKDDDFVKSEWLDMTFSARDYFGTTGAILGGFIVMTIGLMAIAEGIILIIAICVIVFLLSILMLVDIGWFTIISIICAGGIIAWAIIKKKNG